MIKRIFKIGSTVLLLLVLLGGILWLLARTSSVQTWIAGKFMNKIEEQLGANVDIGSITIRWPKQITIENATVWDQLGDTLLHVPYGRAKLRRVNFKENRYNLGKVDLQDVFVYLQEDPAGGVNLSFLLKELQRRDDSVAKPISGRIESLKLDNAHFRYHTFQAGPSPEKFTTNFLDLRNIKSEIEDIHFSDGRLMASVKKLAASDTSGLALRDLSGEFAVENRNIIGNSIDLSSRFSHVEIPDLQIKIPKKGLGRMFEEWNGSLSVARGSEVGEEDFAFFLPDVSGQSDIQISGLLNLSHGELNWSQAQLNYPGLVELTGNLSARNLKTLQETYFHIQLDTLIYEPAGHDQSLAGTFIKLDTLNLPLPVDSIGNLQFSGLFDGRLDDFVTAGSFQSDFGGLNGNVLVQHPDDSTGYQVAGELTGSIANESGWLIRAKVLTHASFSGNFKGSYRSKSQHNFLIDFDINQALINHYLYQNLNAKGAINDATFDGVLLAKDENLDLSLETIADFSEPIPSASFELTLSQANLAPLHLNQIDSVEYLTLNLFGSFKGDNIDNLEGQVWATQSSYTNSRGTLPINDFSLTIGPELSKRQIVFLSEYVDARIFGEIYLDQLIPQVFFSAQHFVPMRSGAKLPDLKKLNDFTFNINLKNPKPISEKISPNLVFQDNSSLSGFFKEGGRILELQGFIPQFLYQDKLFTGFNFMIEADQDSLTLTSDLDKLQFNQYNQINHINLDVFLVPEKAGLDLVWNHTDTVTNRGAFHPEIRFKPGFGKMPRMEFIIPETQVVFNDSIWSTNAFEFILDKSYLAFDSLRIYHQNESLVLDGNLSDLPFDTLYVDAHELNLDHLQSFRKKNSRFVPGGVVNGNTKIFDLHRKGLFLADLEIDDFSLNNELLGQTKIISSRNQGSDDIYMEVSTNRGDLSTLGLNGYYNPVSDRMHFDVNLDKLRMNVFNAVLDPVFRDIRGIASGTLTITGQRSDPQVNGVVNMQKAGFYIDYLNTRYTFTHPLIIRPDGFYVEDLIARDKQGNEALVNGVVSHHRFKDLKLDFKLDVKNFLCLDTDESRGDGYWGTAYATGAAVISGPVKNIRIDVNATTEQGTDFSIPVSHGSRIRDFDFIRYVKKEKENAVEDLIVYGDSDHRNNSYKADLSGLELNFNINATPNARAQIIINSETGDVIRAYGRGNLRIVVDTRGVFSLSGEYLIDQGDYQFTLQNMPLKRFEVEPGGRVDFNGAVNEAILDVDANYRTNASLYDLILDESNPDLRQRTPVECHLLMSGKLKNPNLEFDIVLPPNSDDIARSQLANLSQEEMNRQVLSLLILNQFSPLPGISSATPRTFEGAGITTTTEVLSNQLNYLLSQITNDFDIGFNYLPGDELTSDEVAVALRAQLLENRMTINVNGNVDVRSVETDANQLVGDVEVEYKITPSGKLRVKAFTRANDRLLYEYSQYTQGLGIFFREEFDSLGELVKKYWDGLTGQDGSNTK